MTVVFVKVQHLLMQIVAPVLYFVGLHNILQQILNVRVVGDHEVQVLKLRGGSPFNEAIENIEKDVELFDHEYFGYCLSKL